MSRLIDTLHRRGVIPMVPPGMVFVDGGEVAQYVADLPDAVTFSDDQDFPNCAPPWAAFWLEFRVPRQGWLIDAPQVEREFGRCADVLLPERMAWAVCGLELKTEWQRYGRWLLVTDLYADLPATVGLDSPFILRRIYPIRADGTLAHFDAETPARLTTALTGLLNCRRLPTPLPPEWVPTITGLRGDGQGTPALQDALLAWAGSAFLVLKFALCFLNCRNIQLTAQPVSQALRRARAARGRPAITVWKLLRIRPMQRALREHTEKGATLRQALHLCRGHFKHYDEARPLFGRLTGTWWWHQHVRGNAQIGTILKDYAVEPAHEARRPG